MVSTAVASAAAVLFLIESSSAEVPASTSHLAPREERPDPRTLGQKAVMHVYYFAPKTLEITHAYSYLLKDVATCEYTLDATLRAAAASAREGDQVGGDCTSMSPPMSTAQPDSDRLASRLKAL